MIDESVNIKPKIESMIQSVMNVQEAYARALVIDRKTLAEAQRSGDVVLAEETLLARLPHRRDARCWPQVRVEMGLAPDPLAAYRASGYYEKVLRRAPGWPAGGYRAYPGA